MDYFWNGFEKRAQITQGLGKAIGKFSKGGHTAPPIPGAKPHVGKPSALPGQGALVPGITPGVMKSAPSSRGLS